MRRGWARPKPDNSAVFSSVGITAHPGCAPAGCQMGSRVAGTHPDTITCKVGTPSGNLTATPNAQSFRIFY